MEKKVYISKKLYDYINSIACNNEKEQMMAFGGKTIGNTIVVNDSSFVHFDNDSIVNSDDESIEVPLNKLIESMKNNQEKGNDTFIMTHSHPCNSDFFEFMFGDLSDDDEINSAKIRELCNAYGLDYIDGITTGRRLYFWSTHNKEKAPKLLKCVIDDKEIEYNRLTSITEDLEHILTK